MPKTKEEIINFDYSIPPPNHIIPYQKDVHPEIKEENQTSPEIREVNQKSPADIELGFKKYFFV